MSAVPLDETQKNQSAGSLSEAFGTLSGHPWEQQEGCYALLAKLLENATKADPKFRTVKKDNAKLKEKVFDIPGAETVLLSAGFEAEGGALVLKSGDEAAISQLNSVLEKLKEHANACNVDHMRQVRDEKIAREKEIDAKLNEQPGFSRGRHKLNADGQ